MLGVVKLFFAKIHRYTVCKKNETIETQLQERDKHFTQTYTNVKGGQHSFQKWEYYKPAACQT